MSGMSQAGTTRRVRYSWIVTQSAWPLVWMLHRLVSFSRNFPRIGVITYGKIRGYTKLQRCYVMSYDWSFGNKIRRSMGGSSSRTLSVLYQKTLLCILAGTLLSKPFTTVRDSTFDLLPWTEARKSATYGARRATSGQLDLQSMLCQREVAMPPDLGLCYMCWGRLERNSAYLIFGKRNHFFFRLRELFPR